MLTEILETPDLNIIDCISLIESTIQCLKDFTSTEDLYKKVAIDGTQEFERNHRRRVRPKRLDEMRDNEA